MARGYGIKAMALVTCSLEKLAKCKSRSNVKWLYCPMIPLYILQYINHSVFLFSWIGWFLFISSFLIICGGFKCFIAVCGTLHWLLSLSVCTQIIFRHLNVEFCSVWVNFHSFYLSSFFFYSGYWFREALKRTKGHWAKGDGGKKPVLAWRPIAVICCYSSCSYTLA